MRILLIGGTGNVGRELAPLLAARGAEVSILTRESAAERASPAPARTVRGDLGDPSTVLAALREVDGAFLLVPQSPDETRHGIDAVRAARAAGVSRLVYLSVRMPGFEASVPHFASKRPIEAAVRESGVPFTILRPNNFFQNDHAFRDVILDHGIYPQPIGAKGVARVDARDVATAAAVALTEEGHAGASYDLDGPELLTGESVAALYARHLGRPVRYGGDSLDAWADAARHVLPDWLVRDLRAMYRQFQLHGLPADEREAARLPALLGRAPGTFDAFVASTVARWSGERAAARARPRHDVLTRSP